MADPAPDPKLLDFLRQLQIRMSSFRPNIHIMDWVGSNLRLESTTLLDGISFVPKVDKWYELIVQLRIATTAEGQPAFVQGQDPERPEHWAVDASMAATIGTGFREIYRPTLSKRALSVRDLPKQAGVWDRGRSARFGEDPINSLEMSSVHIAVAPDRVNIHIDHTGFVVVGAGGEVIVDPDFAQHIVNELLWKTDAKKYLPNWVVDNTSIMLPSSYNDYSRVGISADVVTRKNYRLTVTTSCSVRGGVECDATLGVVGTFGGRQR